MKTGLLLSLLLGAMATGYLLGSHRAAHSRMATAKLVDESRDSRTIKSQAVTKAEDVADSTDKRSLAEIEEKIRGLKISNYGMSMKAPREWVDLFAQLSAADMPEVLNFVARICSGPSQQALRIYLFQRWAEMDPAG